MQTDIYTKKIKLIYFLLLTSIVTVVFLATERHAKLTHPNPCFSMYNGITSANVDNEYYLDPVDNYLSGNGWRRNPPVGNGTYYRRTPGYSLFYLFTREITPNKDSALIVLVFLQFIMYLLFFISFSKVLNLLEISPPLYNISMLFISIIPYFYHIIPATMTESISVYLISYFIYFILAGYKCTNRNKKVGFYILASFFIGYATLTRPYLGIFLPLLPILVYKEYFNKGLKLYIVNNFLIGLVPIIMISIWTIRNYSISKEVVLLEKAYHPESLDRMKPEFRGFFNLAMSWAEDGPKFNSYQMPLYEAALRGDTSFVYVENCIKAIPQNYLIFYNKEKITNLIRRYQLIVFSQKQYYDKKIAMPKAFSPEEITLENDFNLLVTGYKKQHFVKYYFFVPLTYLKRAIFHSNTVGIFLMQEPFRNHFFLNLLRYLSLLIHVSLYFFIIISFFTSRNNWLYFSIFFVMPVLFLIFFCCYYQTIEQRYLSPILPILILGAIYSLNKMYIRTVK